MKELVIFQEGAGAVIIYDDDNQEFHEYAKKLSSIFQSGSVSILTTSKSSLLIRPSKLVSIRISEIDLSTEPQEDVIGQIKEEVGQEPEEDVIMDAE